MSLRRNVTLRDLGALARMASRKCRRFRMNRLVPRCLAVVALLFGAGLGTASAQLTTYDPLNRVEYCFDPYIGP
jgi:hypothetical protein